MKCGDHQLSQEEPRISVRNHRACQLQRIISLLPNFRATPNIFIFFIYVYKIDRDSSEAHCPTRCSQRRILRGSLFLKMVVVVQPTYTIGFTSEDNNHKINKSMTPSPKPQTTVLIGGSNGTKTLVSILGDKSNPANANHIVRVVTRNASNFMDPQTKKPKVWKCNEQKMQSDTVPLNIFPKSLYTSWTTHLGAADSVLSYSDDDHPEEFGDAFDKALSGIGTMDDGGVADCIVLCCPVNAHLPILKRIARSLYKLDRKALLLKSPASGGNAPPILIGSLYAAGGLDWQSRMAFASERPTDFGGTWKRDLVLFGLKAFPYLTKSTEPGVVNLFGRYPQVIVAVSPPTPRVRARARQVLDRVLQTHATNKTIHFLGVGGDENFGGDGSASVVDAAAALTVARMVRNKHSEDKESAALVSSNSPLVLSGKTDLPADIFAQPMADHADPTGSIGFMTCTLNATNQWLHPCIMAALFHDPANPNASDQDGRIPWPLAEKKTPLPRFYGDGAAVPEAGRLITAIACAEVYPILDCIDSFFSPSGMKTISQQHGGEQVGRTILNFIGNSPQDVGQRSGLTEMVLKRAQGCYRDPPSLPSRDRVRQFGLSAWMMGFGLSHNYRIGQVLSPAERILDVNGKPTDYIRPIPTTRFFVDDVNHGLCICLGLGELFGFDLERDMPDTLATVRRLQHWMGKEFVLPKGKTSPLGLVGGARDLAETASPQAFGVTNVRQFKAFLALSPIGEDVRWMAEERAKNSPLGRLNLRSKL